MKTAPTPVTIEEKRAAALAYLGTNWVLHPAYKPQPQHSLHR